MNASWLHLSESYVFIPASSPARDRQPIVILWLLSWTSGVLLFTISIHLGYRNGSCIIIIGWWSWIRIVQKLRHVFHFYKINIYIYMYVYINKIQYFTCKTMLESIKTNKKKQPRVISWWWPGVLELLQLPSVVKTQRLQQI